MKIKSGVWYWLAVASGAVGLLYGLGLEGSFQTGGTVSDADFITAMVLILPPVWKLCGWASTPPIRRKSGARRCTSSPATP